MSSSLNRREAKSYFVLSDGVTAYIASTMPEPMPAGFYSYFVAVGNVVRAGMGRIEQTPSRAYFSSSAIDVSSCMDGKDGSDSPQGPHAYA